MTESQFAKVAQPEHMPEVVSAPSPVEYPLFHTPRSAPGQLPDSLLARTFRRRWRLMVIVFVVALVCGLTPILLLVHPTFQAEARLQFKPRPGLNSSLSDMEPLVGYSGYLGTALLRIPESDITKLAVAKLGKSWGGTAEDLSARTLALHRPSTQTVSVIVSGRSPDGLVEAANAVADAYIEHDIIPQLKSHRQETEPVRAKLTALRRQKDTLLETLAGRDSETYIRELYRLRDVYLEPLGEAKRELSAERAEYMEVSAKLASLTAMPADSEMARSLLAELVKDDPLIDMYRSIYQAMIATSDPDRLFEITDGTVEDMISKTTARPAADSSNRTGSNKAKDTEQARRASIMEQIRQGMSQRLEELRQQALDEATISREAEIAAQKAVAQQKQEILEAKGEQVANLIARDTMTAQEITEVRRMAGEVKDLENQIVDHADQLRDLAVKLLPPAQPEISQLAERAVKIPDLGWLFIAASVVSSLLISLFSAMLVEHFDARLTQAGDIVRRVGIPVLASLPGPDEEKPEEMWLPEEITMADYINDQYRNIRTAVLFGQSKVPRVVVVTAPTAAETKTTLSVNLAISIARSGRTALLIDADLENPSLADVFDIAASPGWSDLLRDPAGASGTLCRTRVERLSVMPAGSHLEHSAELLSSPSCRALLDELSQRFEHIIIDAPPLLDCPEGRIIGALADGVICSFSARSTRSGQAREATAILEELGASVIGSVLNT